MRPAKHHGVSLPLRNISTNGDQVTKLLSQQDDAVAQLQADGCVDDVVGGCAEVNAPSGLTSRLSHGLGQGHDVMSSFSLNFTDTFFGDGFRIRNRSHSVVVLFRHTTELPMRPNQGAFHFQLALVSTEFGPNAFEILATIPIIKWTKGHALRHTARFINLPTHVHEDGF